MLLRNGCDPLLGPAMSAANTPKRDPNKVISRRIWVTLDSVSAADCGKPTRQRGARQGRGMIGEISSYRLRSCWYAAAP
jgi:hypothetical protein